MPKFRIRSTIFAIAVLLSSPVVATGTISRVAGPTPFLVEPNGIDRGFQVAFDTVNRVYLVAWGTLGTGQVSGIFLDAAGTPLGGRFRISGPSEQSGWAQVIYANGKFLVTYTKRVSYPAPDFQKAARFLTYAGNGTAAQGAEIIIDSWSGHQGTETGITYSSNGGGRFFVTWWKQGYGYTLPTSFVAVLDPFGQILASHQLTNPADGMSDPEIACEDNRCLVVGQAWGVLNGEVPATWGRFIDATSGLPEGTDSFYMASSAAAPQDHGITFSVAGKRFVVGYVRNADVLAHLVDPNTKAIGAAYTVLQSIPSQDIGYRYLSNIVYNPASQSIFLSANSWLGYPIAQELDRNGALQPNSTDIVPNNGPNFESRSKRSTVSANESDGQFILIDNDRDQTLRFSRYSTGPLGPAPLALTAFSSNTAFPAQAGTSVTWTAATSGGTSPVQYQFWRYTEGTGWAVGQDYSTSNTFTWAPPVGSHAIQVWVRNSGSTAKYDVYASTGMFQVITPAPRLQSLAANTTFPAPLNVPITFTATASGGTGAIEYQFWRYNEKTGWQLAQPYGPSNTYTAYPPAGSNAVQVWIRTVGSGATLEDWKGTPLFSVQSMPARLTSLTPDFQFYSPIGLPITFTAAGSGGEGALEYKFFIYSYNTGLWYTLNQWGPAPYVTWTPSAGTSGQYRVQAWVRTAGKAVQYEDWRQTDLFLITDSTSLALTASQPLQGVRSGNVTFTATVGGAGPWEYRFVTFDGTNWVTAAIGSENTFTWNLTPGTRALQVWIRRPGTVSQWERWQGTGLFIVNP